jgi:hypothetical protein
MRTDLHKAARSLRLVAAMAALAGPAGLALAGDGGWRGGRDHDRGRGWHGGVTVSIGARPAEACRPLAGRLQIGRRSFEIYDDGCVLTQISEAFRCAGYDACVEDGVVRVGTGRRAPALAWSSRSWRASFDHRGHGLRVRAVPIERCDVVVVPSRPVWTPPKHDRPRWHGWDRRRDRDRCD